MDPLAPVTAVSWYDCVKWCNARSEKNGLVPVYYLNAGRTNEAYDLGPTRGYHPAFQGKPAPVGIFPPNGYGLYDAAGNVWEWCWDWFSHTYYASSPADNPRGPAAGSVRVARGSSYYNVGFYARCAYRNFWAPTNRFDDFGFRCVRTQP
ncbi:MAG TPA: SUMF1/EgtB/PvdO family nonheme iron enzyme [Verrucomicrobiota bacterium]|nr:SUMF1/EgtB/PvdO family nonheme iron enzyme [Verrucomicrobiota bacterium]